MAGGYLTEQGFTPDSGKHTIEAEPLADDPCGCSDEIAVTNTTKVPVSEAVAIDSEVTE